ncbi:MAG: anticodon nuclease [Gemmatimonadota bacterium]
MSTSFPDLPALAAHLRTVLNDKRFVVLYAYNGTGKTRLSTEFKKIGKRRNPMGEIVEQDTLYFNAYTEDLFSWDNDLENDAHRVLELNDDSTFFEGLRDYSMDVKIGKLLDRYADFAFDILLERRKPAVPPNSMGQDLPPAVLFFRERDKDNAPIPIKASRGEERIFIWCFFLAIAELAMSKEKPAAGEGASSGRNPTSYEWVKYLYIDDPVSSLDEQNVVAVATHLAATLKDDANPLKTVISTHQPLFFNVLYNELSRVKGNRFFFLGRSAASGTYSLVDTGDTPFFHHIACLMELHEAARSGQIFTHHFNMLRVIAEKTASFLGYDKFADCIKRGEDDLDGVLHTRLLNLLSHGKYSLYEPQEMLDENKHHFKRMLADFTERFAFNPERFPRPAVEDQSTTPREAQSESTSLMPASATSPAPNDA